MKRLFVTPLLIAVSLLGYSQPGFIEKISDVSVISGTKWKTLKSESEVLFMKNYNHNLALEIWHDHTDVSAKREITNILRQEGMVLESKLSKTYFENRESILAHAMFNELQHPYRALVMVVKMDEGFTIIKFTCPDECYWENRQEIKKILESIDLKKDSEHIGAGDSFEYS